ncbi:DUF2029 domain-containing protein [bacterium]|nr:DUF2029 domain-containing protein [bacterium]
MNKRSKPSNQATAANGNVSDTNKSTELANPQYFWFPLLPAALLMISICAAMRFYWEDLLRIWHTYPSDVWYIYDNYGWFLVNQKFFNIEYPAPMFVLFKVLAKAAALLPGTVPHKNGGTIFLYRNWLIVNSIFLGGCGIASVWCTHQLNCRFLHLPPSKVLWGFVLTPAFLFFTIYNYDLVTILCCAAALLCYMKGDFAGCGAWAGLGFAFKVYPGVLFPLLWLLMPAAKRLSALGAFILPWAIINIPYMRFNFDIWKYPYVWQAEFDNSEQSGHLIYHLTQLIGKVPALLVFALAIMALLYAVWKRRPASCASDGIWIMRCSLLLIAAFIMLKNVFSPQYILWLTPFLAFTGGYPFYGAYTLTELMSGIEVTGLFYWQKHYPMLIPCCRLLRDLSIAAVWGWTFYLLCYRDYRRNASDNHQDAVTSANR